jgi:hypothetical protein
LKGDHPRTIPAKFALIWFSGFRGEDLNVIFYQNMPNLHNLYKSAERKIPLFNQQQCFIYSTASFLSKLRAKKEEKLHNSSFYWNSRK